MRRQNILLLSAGRRVELLESFRKSLSFHLPLAKVLAADTASRYSAACHLADSCFDIPRVSDPGYIDALLALCREQQVGLVVPTIDTELMALSWYRYRFLEESIQPVISDAKLIARCRDKRLTVKVFKSIGIDTPDVYSRDALAFPCFCKPYDGSSGKGAFLVSGPDRLSRSMLEDERNIFMEPIGKDYDEYTIDAYYDRHGNMRCLVPRQRLEVRGGEVSKGITRRGYVYDYLAKRLKRLNGARGCITVQLFYHPVTRSIKAFEINPRFGGGFPLADAAGANYPDWLIREYLLDQQIESFDSWQQDLLMLRYDAKVLVPLDK
ncbi:ATP-grasp domain-containing protein [Billgrantia bachuensis]|uniref:ATP-grasp domain-containing protein n=1 Tax=Billgrantia bachuensis TaxID=2717286 RepID=A0ABX0PQ90_9GAMM|nr:ATP-grasp domain-containing protein [Halomonas bachuensis]NIC04397.1 ATP-grasp domain-containing protein [Halomonas bachuensis]